MYLVKGKLEWEANVGGWKEADTKMCVPNARSRVRKRRNSKMGKSDPTAEAGGKSGGMRWKREQYEGEWLHLEEE